jgi:hypothetical protein
MPRHLRFRPAVVGRRRPWFAIALVAALTMPALVMDAQAAGAAVDRNDTSHETPATLSHLDPYRLDQVTLAGSHNTYEKKGRPNDATGQRHPRDVPLPVRRAEARAGHRDRRLEPERQLVGQP